MSEIEMLPDGCGYQGYEFGANYLDSICYGGRLWDADKCDESGNLYEPGDYIPCPNCRFKAAVSRHAEYLRSSSKRARGHKWFFNQARRQLRAYLIRNGYGSENQ